MRVLVAVAALACALGGSGSIGGCSSSASSGSDGNGTPACTPADGNSCPTGAGALQICTTKSSDGGCSGAYFTVGSLTFECNSCLDTTACQDQAVAVCYGNGGTGGDAGSGGSSGGSSSGSSGSSGGSQDASPG
jgi:hypothetical protein